MREMSVDDIYLENIDEYIKDERKLVTYKWLSLTLQVHCNTAKQMLYKYIDTERNAKETDGLYVTYFVSGLTKPNENGEQTFKCSVVPEEKLESHKSTLAVLTSCHIYSVQMTKLKDSNALYMTDYEKFKENALESNKYSSIRCERAEARSAEDMQLLTMNYMDTSEAEKKPTVTNGSSISKPAGKKQPQSALQNMFSKAEANKKQKKDAADTKTVVKTEAKESNKPSKKTGGMMAFFSKETVKGKASKAPVKESTKPSPKKTKAPVKESTKPSPKKTKSPVKEEIVSKKKAREEDSDDEVIGRSKRRRTGQDLFDSDSEEDMEAEEESPIPPTPPPKQATPEPVIVNSSPEIEEIEDPVPKATSKTEESSKSTTGTKRRIKKRKAVNKTYMDNDGFMVTEKVYEEVSTDASECDEPVKKETKKQLASKSPTKGRKSPKKTSPGKKGQGGGKQTSMMSFFTKKN